MHWPIPAATPNEGIDSLNGRSLPNILNERAFKLSRLFVTLSVEEVFGISPFAIFLIQAITPHLKKSALLYRMATWNVPLEINNLTARVNAAAGGSSSVAAGTGIAVSTAVGVSTVSNTGVLSVTAGNGIGVTAGQTPTVTNTGVLSVTAGGGIGVTGGQFATIANTGILSLTAGSGVSITAGQNPTITATPAPPPAGALIDLAGAPVTITAAQLSGCLIYSSVQMPHGNTTIKLPGLTELQAEFGMGPVFINFTIGVLNQYGGPYPPDSETVTIASTDDTAWIQSDYVYGSSQGTQLISFPSAFSAPSTGLLLAGGNMWRGSLYLDPTGVTVIAPGRAIYSFNFVGLIPQASI
jgi:hypothetical protein